MVSVIALVSYNHNVICYDNYLFNLTKVLVKLPLENISCDCDSKWHYCVSVPAKLCIKGGQVGGSFIQLLMPIPLLTVAYCHHTSFRQQVCNIFRCPEVIGLTYNGALFKLVGSKYMCSLRFPASPCFLLAQSCLSKVWLCVLVQVPLPLTSC